MIPPQCLPRTRPGRPRKAERSAEIKRLIDFVSTSPDLPAAALRLGLLLELGIPAAEARKLLGFSKTTYYRALKDIPTHR